MSNCQKKVYYIEECAAFRRTHEKYGGLSNMAGGYPIYIKDKYIRTSEALYQACRFPDHPQLQEEIIAQKSPMTAKSISRKYDHLTRKDWMQQRVRIMNWCIHMKLLYNWKKFGNLFEQTGDMEIVELSSKDDFWGAFERSGYAEGYNVLGLLLKQTRRDYFQNQGKETITLGSLNLENFCLFGWQIGEIKVDVTRNYHIGENYNLFDDFGVR